MSSQNSPRKFGEYAVAGTAFMVSVCSLFIYIYQSKLMAEQQQVAVWPYVQWDTTNHDTFEINVRNKGVGPAIVRKAHMSFNGKAMRDHRELVLAVMENKPNVAWINSYLEGSVLAPGEKLTVIALTDPAQQREFATRLNAGKFAMEITYCSIYGRCWTTSGTSAKRAADDHSIDY
jgi:hypothetical protein